MKNPVILRSCILLCLLSASFSVLAFQVADGNAPGGIASGKYIFYWGKQQCDLSEANAYRGNVRLSPADFRQMILVEPKLWDGASLLKDFRFKLNGITVSTTEYTTNLGAIHEQINPDIISGNTINLSDLKLAEGLSGSISFEIGSEEVQSPAKAYANRQNQQKNFLNEFYLNYAVWGREDIYEISNRDFFSVQEFWQNVRQEPAAEWHIGQKQKLLRCFVTLTSKDNASMAVEARLEEGGYSLLLAGLEKYRYMIQPGSSVTLELQTADQYELLFRKTMSIVAPDDPRLRLRRKRDQHKLSIQWGDWSQYVPEQYMLRLTNPQGDIIHADAPATYGSLIGFDNESLANWGKTKPQCRIDDEVISGSMSFRVTLSDSLTFWVNTAQYEADSINALFDRKGQVIKTIVLDSFQMEGYDLASMTFTLYLNRTNREVGLIAANSLEKMLKAAEQPSKVKLYPPVFDTSEAQLKFELPERTFILFSIFDPEGGNSYIQDDTFIAGENTIRIPREVLKKKGKYYAFLNTALGVAKAEFEIK